MKDIYINEYSSISGTDIKGSFAFLNKDGTVGNEKFSFGNV